MIAAENQPVRVVCKVLGVSESGFYEQRKRPPSQRAVRHAMLTDLITQVHIDSHGFYGGRRVHVELLDRKKWNTRSELANTTFEYLEIWHNRKRRQSQLGWLTPIEFDNNRIIAVA